MHVNALRRQTAFPSNWIRFKTNVSRETPPPQQRQEKEFSKTITRNLTTPPRFTWNTNHQQLTEKKQRSQTTNPTVFHVEHDTSLNKLTTPTTPTHEAYSAAGEMRLSRSRHSRSLRARKTKLDDMFFLIFYLLV